eukprot:9154416-Ditylum_brightwellii.AAC.1
MADYDVRKEIEPTKDWGIDLKANWVKAHQDNNTPAHLFLLDAQLNVIADTDVTIFWQSSPAYLAFRKKLINFPAVHSTISINGIFIARNLQQII